MKMGFMKSKIMLSILALILALSLTSCQKKPETGFMIHNIPTQDEAGHNFPIPDIPDDYTVDKNLYVAQENGIYVFIEGSSFDYAGINSELCKGNAASIKEQYERMEIPESDLIDYAALQNILGITEIYLSDYAKAYDHFCDAIQFIERRNLPEKDSVLTVLYNNAGAATIYLSANAPEDRRLLKASGLCRDPYMGLIIAINQTGRIKVYASGQECEIMIARANEMLEKEELVNNSTGFVHALAIKCIVLGYTRLGNMEEALRILEKAFPEIPDMQEYSLLKAGLLTDRGICKEYLGEHDEALQDFRSAIAIHGKILGSDSRQAANTYFWMGMSYMGGGNASEAAVCFEKTIPGMRCGVPGDKWKMYWNAGYSFQQSGDYEKAKEYLLKAYVHNQAVIKEAAAFVDEERRYEVEIKEALRAIYEMEGGNRRSFERWLRREAKKAEKEEKQYEKLP